MEGNRTNSNTLHFGIYNHVLTVDGDKLVTRKLIVLKDERLPVAFTNFDTFAGGSGTPLKYLDSNDGPQYLYVCKFLNYVFFEKYSITKLTDITAEMLISFLKDYGSCTLPNDDENTSRSKSSVNRCVNYVLSFVHELERQKHKTKVDWKKIYRKVKKISTKARRVITEEQLAFEIRYKENVNEIFRDITEEAFQIIMQVIIDRYTNILMLAALGAFAGLRPSEACNVRREEYGGIFFELFGDEIYNIEIDLTKEVRLRSDDVPVGGIKKHRRQKVYPAFLAEFRTLYEIYMDFIEGRKFETDYGPLTTNQSGKAFTYDAYLREFKKVICEAREIMIHSDNPSTQLYGHMLYTHSLTPHIFRHWFTVKLVQFGEQLPTIMKYRGDRSPESANTYLQNKSELIKQLDSVEDEIWSYNTWRVNKIYGQSNPENQESSTTE